MSTTTRAAAMGGRASMTGLPTGQSIATYDAYADAQRAVDYLSDQQFPVQHLSIVGTDLKQIERVTGRLSWGRVIAGGVLSGVWLGLLIGLLFALFTTEDTLQILLFCIVWAAVFGVIFAAVGYALTGGRRDFTSLTVTVASKYEIFCQHQHAAQARQLLGQLSLKGTGTITPEATTGGGAAATADTAGTAGGNGSAGGSTAGGAGTAGGTGTASQPLQPDLPEPGLPTPAEPTLPPTPTPDPGLPEPPQNPRPPATA